MEAVCAATSRSRSTATSRRSPTVTARCAARCTAPRSRASSRRRTRRSAGCAGRRRCATSRLVRRRALVLSALRLRRSGRAVRDAASSCPRGCSRATRRYRRCRTSSSASKAPWHEIHDDAPRFDEFPPGFGAAGQPTRRVDRAEARRGARRVSVRRGRLRDRRADRGRDRLLSLLALPQGARRRARDEPVRAARALPLAARRGPRRRVQGARGGALHAGVLPRLRLGRSRA